MAQLENIDKIAQHEGVLTKLIGWVLRGKKALGKTDSQKCWISALHLLVVYHDSTHLLLLNTVWFPGSDCALGAWRWHEDEGLLFRPWSVCSWRAGLQHWTSWVRRDPLNMVIVFWQKKQLPWWQITGNNHLKTFSNPSPNTSAVTPPKSFKCSSPSAWHQSTSHPERSCSHSFST